MTRAVSRWLFGAGVVLAVISQVALALSPLGEAREGRGYASHVENAGTSTHYAHNDATCATCQARSITGLAAKAEHPRTPSSAPTLALSSIVEGFACRAGANPHSPRAPPVAIEL